MLYLSGVGSLVPFPTSLANSDRHQGQTVDSQLASPELSAIVEAWKAGALSRESLLESGLRFSIPPRNPGSFNPLRGSREQALFPASPPFLGFNS